MNELNRKKCLDKGSITVEATFVVFCSLLIIFVILSICFYMHNRAWYSAAAGETAITATTYAVRKDGEYHRIINEKISSFSMGPGFPDSGQGISSDGDDEQIHVSAKPKVPVLMTNQFLQANVDIRSKVVKPVKFIRTIQSLQIIKEQLDGS